MLVSLLACASLLAVEPEREIDFKAIAQAYLEHLELSPTNLTFADLQRDHFATTSLGLFEVGVPLASLSDKTDFADLRDLGQALCSAQIAVLDWVALEAPAEQRAALSADLETLRGWVGTWNADDLRKAAKAGAGRFAPSSKSDAARLEAWTRARDTMQSGAGPLSLDRAPGELEPVGLVLIPERAPFIGLVATLGWIDPDLRPKLWTEDLPLWTFFRYYETQVLTLRFAASTDGDLNLGVRMDSRNDDGLEQHVVQLALRALFDRYFGDRLSPAFNAGLSANIVIDMFGEVDTRTDGDLRARETQPRSMFVPGGASSGGTLPMLAADSPWRLPDQGGDHFLGALRIAQKAAARSVRKSSEKALSFEIKSDDGKERLSITAPFMIPLPWRGSLPGPQFRGEQLEFLRCYRCAFVHWMRTEANGKRSRATLARWLAWLAAPRADLNASFEAVYDLPMSNDAVDAKCLEGRFLRWLSKR